MFISPTILFRHTDFLILYKPESVPVHREHDVPGVLEYFPEHQPLFLCHRLDRDTSGLLLVAKNSESASQLSQLFELRKVEKRYLAVGFGTPKKKQGKIIGDMKKTRDGNWKLLRTKENPAITQFMSCLVEPGVRGFLIKPTTGKTHQIRVALKSLACPVAGDKRYGSTTVIDQHENLEQADRMYLHALFLKFDYGGETYQFTEPPRTGSLFEKLLAQQPSWLNQPLL